MKNKSTQIVLKCTLAGFLLFNIGLLFLNQQYKNKLNSTKQKLEHLENIEIMFEVSKETTVTRFKYEQCNIGIQLSIYALITKPSIPALSITDWPKLVIGLNQNMCRPCVEGVFAHIKEVFPDFESNPDIICSRY